MILKPCARPPKQTMVNCTQGGLLNLFLPNFNKKFKENKNKLLLIFFIKFQKIYYFKH